MTFTCKNARLDRFYISGFMTGYVKKKQSATLPEIADHKLVLTDLDLEELKLWGKFYWKMNYHYLGDIFNKREIQKLFEKFDKRKPYMYILVNWEIFKLEVKKVTNSFCVFRAKHRTNIISICNKMKERDFDMEILQNITNIEQEIKNFISKGNMIRSKSEVLNKIYEEGKEISRKEEIKKGNYKFIHQLRSEVDKPIMDKEKIINEIKNFYQNLFTSQKIKEKDIEDYLSDFKPPNLKNENREMSNNYI